MAAQHEGSGAVGSGGADLMDFDRNVGAEVVDGVEGKSSCSAITCTGSYSSLRDRRRWRG